MYTFDEAKHGDIQCSGCHLFGGPDEFHNDRSRYNGKTFYCKGCVRLRRQASREYKRNIEIDQSLRTVLKDLLPPDPPSPDLSGLLSETPEESVQPCGA